jgi:hypothetical protein
MFKVLHSRRRRARVIHAAALGAPSLALLLGHAPRAAAAQPPFQGTWTSDESSVKIILDAASIPPGTQDILVYDAANPQVVKYAGRFPGATSGYPSVEIDWDRFAAGETSADLVVEAIDAMGEAPCGNMVDASVTAPTCTPVGASSCGSDVCCYNPSSPSSPIGLSEGWTLDGKYSINGQGACDSLSSPPHVLGTLYANGAGPSASYLPIPTPAATSPVFQSFFDTFDASSTLTALLSKNANVDYSPTLSPPACTATSHPHTSGCNLPPFGEGSSICQPSGGSSVCPAPAQYLGITNYTLNGPGAAWDIFYNAANLDDGSGAQVSQPLFQHGGFQDILASGPSSTYWPLQASLLGETGVYAFGSTSRNERYASMAISPKQIADLSNGKVLHLTFEVDARLLGVQRWVAVALAPAGDPIVGFRFDDLVPATPIIPNLPGYLDGFNTASNANDTDPSLTAGMVALNNANHALWFQIFDSGCDAALFSGPNPAMGGAGNLMTAGSVNFVAPYFTYYGNGGTNKYNFPGLYNRSSPAATCQRAYSTQLNGATNLGWPTAPGGGHGQTNRSRFDVFLTTQQITAYEDGQQLLPPTQIQNTSTSGLPSDMTQVKVYFIHYGYGMNDSDQGQGIMSGNQGDPSETPTKDAYYQSTWDCGGPGGACTTPNETPYESASDHGAPIKGGAFPYTDQRSWDNVGFEVLPAGQWSNVGNLITLPGQGGTLSTSPP